jgi:hypothetical protein
MGCRISRLVRRCLSGVLTTLLQPLYDSADRILVKRDNKNYEFGKRLRDHLLRFSYEDLDILAKTYPEIPFLIAAQVNPRNSSSMAAVDKIASALSNQALFNILVTNITAGEQLVSHLPNDRKRFLLKQTQKLGGLAMTMGEEDKPSPTDLDQYFRWEEAAMKLNLCLRLALARNSIPTAISETQRLDFPIVRSQWVESAVVVSNLPAQCVEQVNQIPNGIRDAFFERVGPVEDWQPLPTTARIVDSTTIAFHYVPAAFLEHAEAVQLTLAMLPSIGNF